MPGDPVEQILIARYGVGMNNSVLNSDQIKSDLRSEMGLDQAIFYFSINAYSQSDTLYKVSNPYLRNAMARLTDQYGCWPEIQDYFIHINSSLNSSPEIQNELKTLLIEYDTEGIISLIEKINNKTPLVGSSITSKFTTIKNAQSSFGNYIPTINLHGASNQYHTWLFGDSRNRKGIIRGDFGVSFKTGEPVSDFVWKKIGYSLELIFFAMILAFAIAIPTGMRLSRLRSKRAQNLLSIPVYLLYSIPGYLGATLLIFFFANDQALHWFPESGLYPIGYHAADHSYFENLVTGLPYMILPMITFGYSAFSFISKLSKNLSQEELQFDYVQTAYAKGLSSSQVQRKHILKNILVPLITLFTQILPAAVGGTLVVELIFQYPGLGKTVYDAALNSNYPVIIAVFTITGIFTLSAYFIADLLYAFVNPKLRHQK
ncbi:MAG: peptide/nickel transport system permease protein [Parvicellaceae bacterium]|jgi:peptide/nickel transport system permease protein